jgi:hypothetical protein
MGLENKQVHLFFLFETQTYCSENRFYPLYIALCLRFHICWLVNM